MNRKKMYVQPNATAVKIEGRLPLATSPEGTGENEGYTDSGNSGSEDNVKSNKFQFNVISEDE